MKKLLILALILFATPISFTQEAQNGWLLSTTVDTTGAGLTGGIISLPSGGVPVLVYVDTLTDASTIKFEVLRGDTTGYSTAVVAELWRTLSEQDDGSTDWSATLTDDKETPLDPAVMMSLLGRDSGYKQQRVWIRPILSAKQDDIITVYIWVRWI
jgi:hypothetical protein